MNFNYNYSKITKTFLHHSKSHVMLGMKSTMHIVDFKPPLQFFKLRAKCRKWIIQKSM